MVMLEVVSQVLRTAAFKQAAIDICIHFSLDLVGFHTCQLIQRLVCDPSSPLWQILSLSCQDFFFFFSRHRHLTLCPKGQATLSYWRHFEGREKNDIYQIPSNHVFCSPPCHAVTTCEHSAPPPIITFFSHLITDSHCVIQAWTNQRHI